MLNGSQNLTLFLSLKSRQMVLLQPPPQIPLRFSRDSQTYKSVLAPFRGRWGAGQLPEKSYPEQLVTSNTHSKQHIIETGTSQRTEAAGKNRGKKIGKNPNTSLHFCLRVNICVLSKLMCWNLIPKMMVLGGRASGMCLGLGDSVLVNGNHALKKGTPEAPCLFPYLKMQRKNT